jgi:hypothetical protein
MLSLCRVMRGRVMRGRVMRAASLLVFLVLVPLFASARAAPRVMPRGISDETVISVAPEVTYAVNGASEIAPVLSQVANGSSGERDIAANRDLHIPGSRL